MTFRSIQEDVETVFTEPSWVSLGIPTIPANVSTPTGSEFVRLNIFIPASQVDEFGGATDVGFVEINVFTLSGQGEKRMYEICDSLDVLLNGKTLGETQFGKSTLTKIGLDPEDSQLWRVDYIVPFTTHTTL
jgi:hypothetical protein